MDRAHWLVDKENIRLTFCVLPRTMLGFYRWDPPNLPTILLQHDLQYGPFYLLRSTLWHELGHHFTIELCDAKRRWPSYTRYLHQYRQETRAQRWASEHILVPKDWEDIDEGEGKSEGELADKWQVTLELATVIMKYHNMPHLPCTCSFCLGESRQTYELQQRRYL